MERNFLSRYNNKVEDWNESIKNDPRNKNKYESEMAEYIIKLQTRIMYSMFGKLWV